jgi:sigma-B regulation protein RsbU (phosphoserine phosphatase)
MYSDGIFERENKSGISFGIEGLKKTVEQHKHKNPEEMVTAIFKTVFEYGDSKNWLDDASLLIVKRMK